MVGVVGAPITNLPSKIRSQTVSNMAAELFQPCSFAIARNLSLSLFERQRVIKYRLFSFSTVKPHIISHSPVHVLYIIMNTNVLQHLSLTFCIYSKNILKW